MTEETMATPKPVDEMTFREAMDELNATVASLESNTLELEQSLAAYERGVALLRSLRSRLDTAQQKVEVLMGELEQQDSDETVDSSLHKA